MDNGGARVFSAWRMGGFVAWGLGEATRELKIWKVGDLVPDSEESLASARVSSRMFLGPQCPFSA